MRRLLPLVLLFLMLASHSSDGKEQYIYTQISQKEGLTSTIDCIYKELNGDVWISTRKGLYRFNGHTLHHCEDSLMKDVRVICTELDRYGNLWALTDNWIFKRDKGADSFRPVRPEGENSPQTFHSLCCDETGVWLGSIGKIYRYSYADGTIRLFSEAKKKKNFIFRFIEIIDENTLLCCSHNGIVLIDRHTGKASESSVKSEKEVSSMLIDSRGRYWIAYYNQGITVYDSNGTQIRTFHTGNSALSNNVVLCMTERDSEIWAGTDGGGINIIDIDTDRIRTISRIPGDPASLPAHSIKSIHTDHYGNVWAGSIRDGLICISQSKMFTYRDVHIGLEHGLSNATVLSLHQEPDSGYIWIGTDGEGINRLDPSTNNLTHYLSTLKMKVVSIATYSPTELILSVYADGMWLFDKRTGRIRRLEIDDHALNYQIKYSGRSVNLLNDTDGGVILMGNRLLRLDKTTHRCRVIPDTGKSKTHWNMFYAGRTDEGIWLHDNRSIYLLPPQGDSLRCISENHRHRINCGHIDRDGLIWLATDEGLCRFSTKTRTFNHFESDMIGQASNVVCDGNGRVWVGTDSHLYAYLTDSDNFAIFGESDGAGSNEYLSKPHLLSSNGDVYMGGVQGLLRIDRNFTIDASEVPMLSLSDFTVDDHQVRPDKRGICHIPRGSHSLRINVSAQEKDLFRKKMYRFRLNAGEMEYISEEPSLTIRQMPSPGVYEVSVSCTKRNGEWSAPVSVLKLRIPQPWYLTWWFLCSAAGIILMIFAAITVYLRQKEANERKLMEKEQEQMIYEEKVRLLINISHELRTPLTLVMAPLKRLLGGMKPGENNFPTLNRIYRQSVRMKDLLNMVLDLRKMEVGKNRLKIESREFNRWILETIEDIVTEEQAEGIEITTELDPEIGMVEFDRQKCDTVLMNILINAVKHSVAGDKIIIKSVLEEDRVRVSVCDEGPGLGDIDHSKMFTRFYQSNSEQYGSGIGLSYSKILVELHGGSIGAENNEEKGATFWWEIPLHQDGERETPAKAYLNELMGYRPEIEVPSDEDFSTAGMTVMLVEDSVDMLEFMQETFSGEFKEIITVTGGNQAYKMIGNGKLPDLIVSDVNMPDGDGYSLCRRLKEDERLSHIPIILLTAKDEDKSQSNSYRAGADAFLAKPFDTETLMELMRSLLRGKAAIRKKYLDNQGIATGDYGSDEESFILRFNRIVAEHISDPELDQQLLCRELGVSRALLYNKMKSITGAGAKEYITKIRIEKAKTLIETTGLSISEISDMTGFSGQSYFSTAFKNYTGKTPSQYKQDFRVK